MKLLLTSSGITNKTIESALLELLGKSFQKSNIVFIPTAANIEKDGNKTWLVDDMYNFRKLNFKLFDIVDIAAVSKDIWMPSFNRADALVFGGGDSYYLLDQIRKSGLGEVIEDLVKTKVYVGISAGSMITSKNVSLSTAGILYYERYKKFKNKNGLGFVDFEMRPHLNSKWFPKVRLPYLRELAKSIPYSFYAIDDDTAIKVTDSKITVVSEGKWEKF